MSNTCIKPEMYMLWSLLCTLKTTTELYSGGQDISKEFLHTGTLK